MIRSNEKNWIHRSLIACALLAAMPAALQPAAAQSFHRNDEVGGDQRARRDAHAASNTATSNSGGIAGSGPACPVTCPPGGTDENEPCGTSVNGGCSGTCPNYFLGTSVLNCGKTGCGSIWADGFYDSDWWTFLLPITPLTGEKYVCITVESEFPAVVELYTGNYLCSSPTLLTKHQSNDCGSVTFCTCLPTVPGSPKYWIHIYPGTITGGPITSGLPCAAAGRNYTIKLECEDHCPDSPPPIFGACCLPSTNTPCLQTTQLFCDSMGWLYAGDGVSCDPTPPCPKYGACCHQFPGSAYYPCVMTWEDDCLFSGSYIDPSFFAGQECSDINCPGNQCGPGAGPCDVANGSPGCDNEDCCFQVCTNYGMPECCAFEWTPACASIASQACKKFIDPTVGRCCYVVDPASGTVDCIDTTHWHCTNFLLAGVWSPPPLPCDIDECEDTLAEIGACCFVDADGTQNCVQTTIFTCNNTYFGSWYAETDCDPDPCPSGGEGACCVHIDPPYCLDGVTAMHCSTIVAPTTFHIGLSCADLGEDCEPMLEDGACCRLDPASGGYFCFEASFEFCDSLPDTNFHPGLDCTDPIVIDECDLGEPEQGACCYQIAGSPNFTCIDTVEAECDAQLNSTFYPGYTCDTLPDDCCKQKKLGACCYQDATGGLVCEELTQCECLDIGGPGAIFYSGLSCADLDANCKPIQDGACCYALAVDFIICVDGASSGFCDAVNGTFHPGLSCTDATVLEACGLGACCYQDPASGMWTCADAVTTAQCASVPGSQYHPAQTCASIADQCPPKQPGIGACCYLGDIPGGVAHLCVETTAIDCDQSYGGSYLGDGTSCVPNPCTKDCIKPPSHLLAWWTLDDNLGSGPATLDSSGLGAHGFAGGGVASAGGVVNGAFQFNGTSGQVRVNNKAWLNPCPAGKCAVAKGQPFPMQSFTIDAWIKMDSMPAGSGMAPIVDKRLHGPPGPSVMKGYSFFVDGKGRLGLLLEDGCGPTASPIFSPPVVSPGNIAHVAVTAHRQTVSGSVAEFYYNGVSLGTHSISAWPCAMNNKAPLYIGAQPFYGYSAFDGPSFFAGMIDEVQIFRRALDASEIFALFNAGSKGKCKHRCIAPPNTICRNHASKNVTIQVCNDSPLAQTYQVSFTPDSGGGCQPGLVITPSVVSVSVPPLSCAPVTVNMSRPAGLASGLTWCYDVTVANLSSGQMTTCHGTLTNFHSILCHIIWKDDVVIKKKAGVPSPIDFEIHPPDPGHPPDPFAESIQWRIKAAPPRDWGGDPDFDDVPISLNGLPPGVPVEGSFSLPRGFDPIILSVDVEFTEHVPLEAFHIVLELDPQDDGEYAEVAVTLVASDEPAICESDLDGNGTVGVPDLLVLLANWGACPPQIPTHCPGDLTGNGTVGVPDLLELLGNWGECP